MYESANVSDDADRTAFRASRETIQTLLRTRLKVLEKISTRPPHGIRVAESDSSVFCIENRPVQMDQRELDQFSSASE
ncbi:hypothetical protein F2Q68_00042430 [Brassica cretica]|uniref:Uncharacterized protein n=1 Tax=Brassica cretica TaxID=69181 RepID=A0A8S9MP98_BRACR|nr:hypothetical protein F2Q68_00042430 [Brassica cretica]